MRVIIDTREQKPLPFSVGGLVTLIEKKALDVGDYSCIFEDGWQVPLIFERKSLSDLWGTMTSGYKRFKKEIERAGRSNVKLVISVDATITRVAQGFARSDFAGGSMVSKLFTLRQRYGIETVFSPSREASAYYMLQYWSAIGRERQKKLHRRKKSS